MPRPRVNPTFEDIKRYCKTWNIPDWDYRSTEPVPPVAVYAQKYSSLTVEQFRWELQRRTSDYRRLHQDWQDRKLPHIKKMVSPDVEAINLPSDSHYLETSKLAGTNLDDFLASSLEECDIKHLLDTDIRKFEYELDRLREEKKQELVNVGFSFVTLIIHPKIINGTHQENASIAIDAALDRIRKPDQVELSSLEKTIRLGITTGSLSEVEAQKLRRSFSQDFSHPIKKKTAHTRSDAYLFMMVLDGYEMGISPTIIGTYIRREGSECHKRAANDNAASTADRWYKDALSQI